MRPSLSIIFLGWWLTRQRWMARGQRYPKPSISVSPSAVVALEGNVTISCKREWNQPKEISLVKGESSSMRRESTKVAEKDEVTFPITNAKHSDEGTYQCIFENPSQGRSDYSEKVHIKIRKQFYPKPSISVSPNELVALGEATTVHCKSKEYRLAEYSLIKEGALGIIQVKTEQEEAAFSIGKAKQSDTGIYWCEYRLDSDPRYSYFSERVYINVTDASLSKPSIKVTSTEQTLSGFNVTIECQGPEMGLVFSLHKSMDLVKIQTETDSNSSAFQIFMMELVHARNYTCQYRHKGDPFVWSEPSDPLELDKRDSFPIILWASVAVGFLLLVLLLLLLTLKLCRRRKKGSTAEEANQPVTMPLEPVAETDPNEVSYAVLNHHSLMTKPGADPNKMSESCVYASVAKDRTRNNP